MTTATPAYGNWGRVEFYSSYFLFAVLVTVLGMRLGFDDVWRMPNLDFNLSIAASVVVVAGIWFGRRSRSWRITTIVLASATQLVPMVVREPVLLLPLLGALIPVAILVGCLIALSKKKV